MIRVKTDALIRARVKAGLGQRELARQIGRSSGFLSQVESGQSSVSPESAKRICNVLEIPFDSLFEVVIPDAQSATVEVTQGPDHSSQAASTA